MSLPLPLPSETVTLSNHDNSNKSEWLDPAGPFTPSYQMRPCIWTLRGIRERRSGTRSLTCGIASKEYTGAATAVETQDLLGDVQRAIVELGFVFGMTCGEEGNISFSYARAQLNFSAVLANKRSLCLSRVGLLNSR